MIGSASQRLTVLAAMGLTISDAVRLLLTRVAEDLLDDLHADD